MNYPNLVSIYLMIQSKRSGEKHYFKINETARYCPLVWRETVMVRFTSHKTDSQQQNYSFPLFPFSFSVEETLDS